MSVDSWLTVFFLLALASLIPVIWAIVDVARRPAWQFSTGRKVVWAVTLGFGWLLLWPLALISSIFYLAVVRRRFPPLTAGPGQVPPTWQYRQQQYQSPYSPYSPYPPYPQQPLPRDLPPAGWYPDPAGSPSERWWDGRGWSDQLR